MKEIKKVHVIFKTHLDIGFTDTAEAVMNTYLTSFIPRALQVAFEVNNDSKKKFIWTVGSYLVKYYLEHASEDAVEQLKLAIEKGFIKWHGLAVTTHSELMDKDVLEYNLNISKKLDKQFGKETIACKLTDVPGHTIAIVPYLHAAGLKYLHVGVNGASKLPNVPEMFVWKNGDSEIIVHYANDYGKPSTIEGLDEAIEFAHTNDNRGPQTEEEINCILEGLGKKYPNAAIEASTLDDYAKAVIKIKHLLPVVEEEIGDTWIHGVASDPIKTKNYKELLALKNRLIAEGRLDINSDVYDKFMEYMLLVAEHTWGMDFKTHLIGLSDDGNFKTFKNWSKQDFQKARKSDNKYQAFNASFAEKRNYTVKAMECLGEYGQIITGISLSEGFSETMHFNQKISIGDYVVSVSPYGSINFLQKGKKIWINNLVEMGKLEYEVFDYLNAMNDFYYYTRNIEKTKWWAENDMGKPGLELVENLKNKCFSYAVTRITKDGNQICIDMVDYESSGEYGMPRKAQILYTFGEKIICSVAFYDKDAIISPEANWFNMNFDTENPNRWSMQKINQNVSPTNVVKGGNRKAHCVEKLIYDGADGRIVITPKHSPIVCIGGKNLFYHDDKLPNLYEGFSFLLHNNKWNTNFKMWFEEDFQSVFEIEITNK